MNTSKKWRKPLFRQAVARRLSEAAGLVRRPGSGAGRAAGRSLRRRKFQRPGGAAAFGGPGALGPPGLPNKSAGAGAKGPGPALSGRFASCRRPPGSLEFPSTPKGNAKARPFAQPCPAPSFTRKKLVATPYRGLLPQGNLARRGATIAVDVAPA